MGVKEVVVVVEQPDSLARLLKNMAPLRGAYRKKIAKKSARHKEIEVEVIWRNWTVKEQAVRGQKQNVKKEGGSKRGKMKEN